MREVLLALPGIFLTILCWGTYGSVLHKGQHELGGDRLKPLICVGLAYLFVAIFVPAFVLLMQGKLTDGWTRDGMLWSMGAGCAGACGALGIILALTAGGKPIYVMPLVFGGAPIINVLVSMSFAKISWKELSPNFIAGTVIVVIGAFLVLYNQPRPAPKGHGAKLIKPPAHMEVHQA